MLYKVSLSPQPIFRKPCSSPFPEVHQIFREAERRGLTIRRLADLSGYSYDALATLRRPHADGSGLNPSFRLIRDLAEVVKLEMRLEAK